MTTPPDLSRVLAQKGAASPFADVDPSDEARPVDVLVLAHADADPAWRDRLAGWGYDVVWRDLAPIADPRALGNPDLIVIDDASEPGAGLAAARAIRRAADFAAVPILAIGHMSEPAFGVAAAKAGCSGHFIQPVAEGALRAIVMGHLGPPVAAEISEPAPQIDTRALRYAASDAGPPPRPSTIEAAGAMLQSAIKTG